MATTMKLIAKQTLTGTAASVTFSDIPGTYTDLYIVMSTRTSRNDEADSAKVTFNGVTTNTYSSRVLYGNGSAAYSAAETSVAYITVTQNATAALNTANTFGNAEMYIPNYAGSTAKSLSATGVGENNATGAYIGASTGIWTGTNAITSVTIAAYIGPNFVSGSSFFLYGITKA